jgi:hypothetical protein
MLGVVTVSPESFVGIMKSRAGRAMIENLLRKSNADPGLAHTELADSIAGLRTIVFVTGQSKEIETQEANAE